MLDFFLIMVKKLPDVGHIILCSSSKFEYSLKALYFNVECIERVNGNMTNWFNVDSQGLNQGCVLSSIMFNIQKSNLVDDINVLHIGFNIDKER